MRSFSATTNQDGLFLQAARLTFSSKFAPRIGPCVTAIDPVSAAAKSWAKCFEIPSRDIVTNPSLSAMTWVKTARFRVVLRHVHNRLPLRWREGADVHE